MNYGSLSHKQNQRSASFKTLRENTTFLFIVKLKCCNAKNFIIQLNLMDILFIYKINSELKIFYLTGILHLIIVFIALYHKTIGNC